MPTLREALTEWTDIDFAEHALAQCLGIFPFEDDALKWKWVYWSNSPLGNALVRALDEYVRTGILEKRDEPDFQYRWCSDYRRNTGLE